MTTHPRTIRRLPGEREGTVTPEPAVLDAAPYRLTSPSPCRSSPRRRASLRPDRPTRLAGCPSSYTVLPAATGISGATGIFGCDRHSSRASRARARLAHASEDANMPSAVIPVALWALAGAVRWAPWE